MVWRESKHVNMTFFSVIQIYVWRILVTTTIYVFCTKTKTVRGACNFEPVPRSHDSTLAHWGGPEGRHGQTTDHWHKSRVRARCPSQELNKFQKQTVRQTLSSLSPRTILCIISTQWSYCWEDGGRGRVFRALTTSRERSHFDPIGMSEANHSCVFALDVFKRPPAYKLHSAEWSPSTNLNTRLT